MTAKKETAPKEIIKRAEAKPTKKQVRPKVISERTILAEVRRALDNTAKLIVRKQKEGKPYKHLFVMRSRLQATIQQFERVFRMGGVK